MTFESMYKHITRLLVNYGKLSKAQKDIIELILQIEKQTGEAVFVGGFTDLTRATGRKAKSCAGIRKAALDLEKLNILAVCYDIQHDRPHRVECMFLGEYWLKNLERSE